VVFPLQHFSAAPKNNKTIYKDTYGNVTQYCDAIAASKGMKSLENYVI